MKRLILMILIGVTCIVMGTAIVDIIRDEPDVINEYQTLVLGVFVIGFSLFLLRRQSPPPTKKR